MVNQFIEGLKELSIWEAIFFIALTVLFIDLFTWFKYYWISKSQTKEWTDLGRVNLKLQKEIVEAGYKSLADIKLIRKAKSNVRKLEEELNIPEDEYEDFTKMEEEYFKTLKEVDERGYI